ncbi:hypothetical protein RJ639_001193 [Escallonia herrerae]|uniref:GAG-pre-integrase domain-containing protein n=1 Tax=Escallonia herrerae TaxID=1293975 RepID=A0AA89BJ57_9ASTE|nr:hypothetical protein RJ639_001193 [Escallonia herrerae]
MAMQLDPIQRKHGSSGTELANFVRNESIGLLKALKRKQGLLDTIAADEKEDMLERAHSSMLLCLADNMLRKGSTITGAAATDSSSDIDSDTTKLWHMCLRHMSERGMDVLSKQGLLGSKKIGKLDFCKHCVFGKQCMVKFSRAVHTAKVQ